MMFTLIKIEELRNSRTSRELGEFTSRKDYQSSMRSRIILALFHVPSPRTANFLTEYALSLRNKLLYTLTVFAGDGQELGNHKTMSTHIIYIPIPDMTMVLDQTYTAARNILGTRTHHKLLLLLHPSSPSVAPGLIARPRCSVTPETCWAWKRIARWS